MEVSYDSLPTIPVLTHTYSIKTSVVDPEWFIPDTGRYRSSNEFLGVPDPVSDLDLDPTHTVLFKHIFKLLKTHHQKEEFINCLPFSITYFSPTVHTVQNSQAENLKLPVSVHLSALSLFAGSRKKFRIRSTTLYNTSVSDQYSLNPDPNPAKSLNPDPDPSYRYFLTLSDIFFLHNFIITRFSHPKSQLKDRMF